MRTLRYNSLIIWRLQCYPFWCLENHYILLTIPGKQYFFLGEVLEKDTFFPKFPGKVLNILRGHPVITPVIISKIMSIIEPIDLITIDRFTFFNDIYLLPNMREKSIFNSLHKINQLLWGLFSRWKKCEIWSQ